MCHIQQRNEKIGFFAYMSENRDADQLCDAREADPRLCLRFTGTFSHLLCLHSPVCVGLGRKLKTGSLAMLLFFLHITRFPARALPHDPIRINRVSKL